MMQTHRFAVLFIFVVGAISTFTTNQFDTTNKILFTAVSAVMLTGFVVVYERFIKGKSNA